MKRSSWWTILICLIPFTGTHADLSLVMFDFDTAQTTVVTDIVQQVTGMPSTLGIASLDVDSIDGDDWLIVDGGDEFACIELMTFHTLFYLDTIDLRHLFNLGNGAGAIASFQPDTQAQDHLLYRDYESDRWYSVNLSDGAFERFDLIDLPGVFATGFSYTDVSDTGLLYQSESREWYYQPIPEQGALEVDFSEVFGSSPLSVSECEFGSGPDAFRVLFAVLDDSIAPTPTPGGSPTPTPTPGGADFMCVLAMGLSEEIWGIDGQNPGIDPITQASGQSPNQVVCADNELFVVNSLSNSITVYDASTLNMKPERSISVGAGRNPFLMSQPVAGRSFVTNLIANTVSVLDLYGSDVVTEIELPGGSDLPHDPGETTWARPSGVFQLDDTVYVACANLGSDFTAAGPGVICRIDVNSMNLVDWFESGGRNPMSITHDSRYPDLLWFVHAGDYSGGFDNNGNIAVYSVAQHAIIETIPMFDAPIEIVFGPDRAYASSGSDGRILRIDLSTFERLAPIDLPTYGQGLNFVSALGISPDQELWATEFNHDRLFIIDPVQSDVIRYDRLVGDGPDAMAFVTR